MVVFAGGGVRRGVQHQVWLPWQLDGGGAWAFGADGGSEQGLADKIAHDALPDGWALILAEPLWAFQHSNPRRVENDCGEWLSVSTINVCVVRSASEIPCKTRRSPVVAMGSVQCMVPRSGRNVGLLVG